MHEIQAMTRESPSNMPDFALKILHALPDPVVSFTEKGRVVFANLAAQELFGRGEKSLQTETIFSLLKETSAGARAARAVIDDQNPLMLHDVDIAGRYAHNVTLQPMEDSGMYLMTIGLYAMNLQSEWTNKTRASLKSAEIMAQMLAHEIKNPLAGIRGAAQLLSKKIAQDGDHELPRIIMTETDRILRLIQKMRVFESAAPDTFKSVNIHQVLQHVAQASRAAFGAVVEIEEKYDPSLPCLLGDFDLLVQATMNLVKNAAEALPDGGGKVSLRTFYDTAPAHHQDTLEKLPLCVEIEDNGAGVAPAAQRHMFEPYFTTKPNGEGLGLAIVSRIIDDHRGAIHVKSRVGGTVFRLSFPMERTKA